MDDQGLATLAWVGVAVGGLIVLAVGAAGVAYAADVPVEATVTEKQCGGGGGGAGGPLGALQDGNTVTVKTKVLSIDHTVEVDRDVCLAVSQGNFVEYYVRSDRTVLYETEGGQCLYDTSGAANCVYG